MDRPTKNNKPFLYILACVVVVLIGLIVFFMMRPNNSTNNNSNNGATPTPTPTASVTPTEEETETTPTASTTATPSTTSTPTSTSAPVPSGGTLSEAVKVKVPFSTHANSADPKNSDETFGYYRYTIFSTKRADTENYVMEKIIAGPVESDVTTYNAFTPLALTGDSNCDGKDFTITKDTAANKITVKFCKQVTTAGIGDDARITSVVKAGMEQFLDQTKTKTIVILTKDGNCFGDQSGQNRCLS